MDKNILVNKVDVAYRELQNLDYQYAIMKSILKNFNDPLQQIFFSYDVLFQPKSPKYNLYQLVQTLVKEGFEFNLKNILMGTGNSIS